MGKHSFSFSFISDILQIRELPNLVLVQPRKTRPCLTERLLMTCADPGIFGRGGPGQSDTKSSDKVFFFFRPQLILQKSNGQFQRNLSFFKVPEGVQHFPGGGGGSNFFQGGPIAYSL